MVIAHKEYISVLDPKHFILHLNFPSLNSCKQIPLLLLSNFRTLASLNPINPSQHRFMDEQAWFMVS